MPLDERDALFQHFLGLAIDRLDPSLRIRGHKPEHIIFRVHDQSSASPLRYNGFTATSRRFKPIARMSNAIWRERYESLHQDENYRNDEHVLKSIAAHVMGGWPGYIRDQTGPSDWISTTKSLDWAVWEITRRLVKMGRNSVELSLIYRRGYRPGDQGVQHVELDATQAVEALGEQVWLNDDQKCARDFAKASSEVICLGRIFGTDIAENTVWTRAVSTLTSSLYMSSSGRTQADNTVTSSRFWAARCLYGGSLPARSVRDTGVVLD